MQIKNQNQKTKHKPKMPFQHKTYDSYREATRHTLTLSCGSRTILSLIFFVWINPVTPLSRRHFTPTAAPGHLLPSKWLHTWKRRLKMNEKKNFTKNLHIIRSFITFAINMYTETLWLPPKGKCYNRKCCIVGQIMTNDNQTKQKVHIYIIIVPALFSV